MRPATTLIAIAACVVGASACAPTQTASSVSSSEAMRTQPVTPGEVVGIRPVDIRPGQTRVGMATGAVLGGIGGSQIGGDTTSNIAGGVAGAVVGGAIGSALQGARVTRGIEIVVKLDSGETFAIVQPGDIRDFRVGDRIRVVGDAGAARVSR